MGVVASLMKFVAPAGKAEAPAPVKTDAERYLELFGSYLRAPNGEKAEVSKGMTALLSKTNMPVFERDMVDAEKKTHLSPLDSDTLRWILRHQRHELRHRGVSGQADGLRMGTAATRSPLRE